jgi:hypothetical protein
VPITGANPVTKPAVTFDSYWISTLNVMAPHPDKKARAHVSLKAYASTPKEDGTHDSDDKTVNVMIPDLFAAAAGDADLAAALHAVFAAIEKIAKQQGKI